MGIPVTFILESKLESPQGRPQGLLHVQIRKTPLDKGPGQAFGQNTPKIRCSKNCKVFCHVTHDEMIETGAHGRLFQEAHGYGLLFLSS